LLTFPRLADTTVFDSVGITDPSTQTGINAGLSMFTWCCQIAAVIVGKRVGRRTIILWVWPTLLLGLIGLCVSRYVIVCHLPGVLFLTVDLLLDTFQRRLR
jgi:hypothetical protein